MRLSMEQENKINSHVLKELLKLYPKIKAPIESKADFYIETLSKHESYKWLYPTINKLNDCYNKHGNITDYKFDILNKLVSFFQDNKFTETVNNYKLPEFVYDKKNFANYNSHNIYISIDLTEANYSVFKKYSGLNKWFEESTGTATLSNEKWYSFLKFILKVDDAVAESKSFRQFVLGNVSPKKIAKLQEYEMFNIVNNFKTILQDSEIVGTSSDEIIVELIDNGNKHYMNLTIKDDHYKKLDEVIFLIKNLNNSIPVKHVIYKMDGVKNLNEFVKVKTIYDDHLNKQSEELFGVDGNRFFMHFRTLILKEELHENDLLYTHNNYLAKWVI